MTVLIPTYVKDQARSWPKHEDAPDVPYAPVEQVLWARHPVDAHFSAYSCPQLPKRLSTHPPAYERIPGGVQMVLMVADADDPVAHEQETPARPGWRFVEQEKVKALLAAHPGILYYETKAGYRLVGGLGRPVRIADDSEYRDWRTRYLCWLGWLSRTWGIVGDPAMRDWTRAYRAPRVMRDGVPQDPPMWGQLGAIDREPEPADLQEVRRLAAQDKAWAQALAGLGRGARDDAGKRYEAVDHGDRLSLLRQYAQKVVDEEPPGRAGAGGGTAMFLVCRRLYRGLALPDDDRTRAILDSYGARCDPPWDREAEVRHKIESAKQTGSIALGAYLPRFEAWLALERQRDGLPVVKLGTDEDAAVNETIGHLARLPELFAHYQSCSLADVLEQEQDADAPGPDGIRRFGGAPRIRQLPAARVRTLTTKVARFERWDGRSRGWEPSNPTEWLVSGVCAEGRWAPVRQIVGLGDSPVILGDGRVLHQRGYDAPSGIFVTSRLPVEVPDRPTIDDARRAALTLLDLVGQFEFTSPAHRSAWLCALLTVLARFAHSGPAPLFLFEASTAGSGKTLLADLISCVAFGRPASRTPFSPHDEEMRKKITSAAMAGDRMILLDNVPNGGVLQSAALDAALTSNGWWKDRVLGSNDVYDGPLLAVFFATGNNLSIAGDLGRRILHSRLEPQADMPELRAGFKYPKLLMHALKNRGLYASCALTILRAHWAAGRPEPAAQAWGSFEGWSSVSRAPLAWMGLPDPGETREELQAMADRGRGAAAALVHELAAAFGNRGFLVSDVTTLAYPKGFQIGEERAGLKEALDELCNAKPGGQPTPHQIGNSLKRIRGRAFDGRRLVCEVDKKTKLQRWRVA